MNYELELFRADRVFDTERGDSPLALMHWLTAKSITDGGYDYTEARCVHYMKDGRRVEQWRLIIH